MTREKILRVVPRLPRDVGAVALETCRAHMARLACPRPCARLSSVPFPEFASMARWRDASPAYVHREASRCGRHSRNSAWNCTDVAARAALPCMTACARHRAGVRLCAVPFPELLRVTRWSAACQERAGRASGTCGRHRRDDARRQPDMTARAALARVARCTGRASALRVSSM